MSIPSVKYERFLRLTLLIGALVIPGTWLVLIRYDADQEHYPMVRMGVSVILALLAGLSYVRKFQPYTEFLAFLGFMATVTWMFFSLHANQLNPEYSVGLIIGVCLCSYALRTPRLLVIFLLWYFVGSLFLMLFVEHPLTNSSAFLIQTLTSIFVFYFANIDRLRNSQEVQKKEAQLTEELKIVTRQKERLRISEERWDYAVSNSQDGVWDVNYATGESYVSPSWLKLLGYDPLAGTPPVEEWDYLVHPDDRAATTAAIQRHIMGEDDFYRVEQRLINQSGVYIWVLSRGKVIEWSKEGQPVRFIGTITDISALVEAREKAEDAARSRSHFLSVMSHEIRTPMNAVIGLTHLLLQENPREDQTDSLSTLKFSAENLLVIINDILDYSKIEAGKIEFEQIEINPAGITDQIARSQRQKAEEKGITLVLDNDPSLPETVLGDPTRISQILSNLVSNAIKFTHQGQVTLSTRLVLKMEDAAEILFTVTDTGIGIAPESIGQIFESFTQASSDTTRKYGGTGLGLTICKRLLELQNSSLVVESEEGKGSAFSFSLLLPLAVAQASVHELPSEDTDFSSLGGVRILLVEDHPVNQKVACKFLAKWEADVDVAGNGLIALEKMEAGTFDLILMDLQMPVMDGYEAVRHIRLRSDAKSRIPIIALTAAASIEIESEVIAAGMNDYASKPFHPRELYRKIARHMPRK
ncbi:MAG: response regulator [Bacteroidetes bacterium]|nr:MAG: response regulator [Bacteroidota bacterium]